MAATRWNSSILEMLNWLYEEHAGMEEMLTQPIMTRIVQNETEEGEQPTPVGEEEQIPKILPVLPLRGVVVFPQTAVPLTIGQSRSIRLVDDVMSSEERLIALVTSRDPQVETPRPDDLYTIGTVAMVHRMFRAPDGTIRLARSAGPSRSGRGSRGSPRSTRPCRATSPACRPTKIRS